MTTTVFLIRHGRHPRLGKVIAGRMPDVHLDAVGREQAQRLAQRLRARRLDLVAASPLERAQETAWPIACRCGLALETAEALDEVDVGAWTGRSLDELAGDPRWRQWNEARAGARAPGGESMREVQDRAVGYLDAVRTRLPHGRVALVTHCDVIRPVLLHCLGMSLDHYDRIEISPSSLSTLVIGDWGSRIASLNEVLVE